MGFGRIHCLGMALFAAVLFPASATGGALAPLPSTRPVATTSRPNPEAYGISQETVTSIPAAALVSWSSVTEPLETRLLDDSYLRFIDSSNGGTLFVPVILPSGAVIDFVGLSACDTVGGQFSINLRDSVPGANGTYIGGVVSTARGGNGCGIDYNAVPIGYSYPQNAGHNLLIDGGQVPGAPQDGTAGIQAVEVWWHRQVSPAPAMPTFNDVPDTDFGYQYIEALAASGITGGCGGGAFCPDNPVTRRQMAIFLTKALGLNWPH
jgi:hypothetical protein